MSFPQSHFAAASDYIRAYLDQVAAAAATVDAGAFQAATDLVAEAMRADRTVYACGNGGSAAIADHLVCDCVKSVRTGTFLRPRVFSLASNIAYLTAVSNDLNYSDSFVYQLSGYARSGDLVLAISSSGNSENIVRALEWARTNDIRSIVFAGFDGGRASRLADVAVHVAADNYGVVEDVHQSLMHAMAQFIRQSAMAPEQIEKVRF